MAIENDLEKWSTAKLLDKLISLVNSDENRKKVEGCIKEIKGLKLEGVPSFKELSRRVETNALLAKALVSADKLIKNYGKKEETESSNDAAAPSITTIGEADEGVPGSGIDDNGVDESEGTNEPEGSGQVGNDMYEGNNGGGYDEQYGGFEESSMCNDNATEGIENANTRPSRAPQKPQPPVPPTPKKINNALNGTNTNGNNSGSANPNAGDGKGRTITAGSQQGEMRGSGGQKQPLQTQNQGQFRRQGSGQEAPLGSRRQTPNAIQQNQLETPPRKLTANEKNALNEAQRLRDYIKRCGYICDDKQKDTQGILMDIAKAFNKYKRKDGDAVIFEYDKISKKEIKLQQEEINPIIEKLSRILSDTDSLNSIENGERIKGGFKRCLDYVEYIKCRMRGENARISTAAPTPRVRNNGGGAARPNNEAKGSSTTTPSGPISPHRPAPEPPLMKHTIGMAKELLNHIKSKGYTCEYEMSETEDNKFLEGLLKDIERAFHIIRKQNGKEDFITCISSKSGEKENVNTIELDLKEVKPMMERLEKDITALLEKTKDALLERYLNVIHSILSKMNGNQQQVRQLPSLGRENSTPIPKGRTQPAVPPPPPPRAGGNEKKPEIKHLEKQVNELSGHVTKLGEVLGAVGKEQEEEK